MRSAVPSRPVFRFGLFEADVTANTLTREGVRVRIQDQPFRLLISFLERAGEIVTREELRQELWPEGTYVDFEAGLNTALKKLRAALSDDSENPSFIETVPRHGYRFIAPVEIVQVPARKLSEPVVEPVAGVPDVVPLTQTSPTPLWKYSTIAVLVIACVGTGWWLWQRQHHSLASPLDISLRADANVPHRKSVAVLGFQNASGKKEDAWLSTALSEMLSTELAGGEKLRLVPGGEIADLRLSSPWPDTDSLDRKTASRLGASLNSDLLISGSYTSTSAKPDSGQVRLDLRLQDARTGEILSEIGQSASREDILQLVSSVGAKLRAKLGVPQLQETDQAGVAAAMPVNRDAARFYALGISKLREFDALAAKDLLEEACKADPKFALAHAMLARAWAQLGYDEKRKEEAKKALDLSANLSVEERLQIEGDYYDDVGDHEKAASSYRALFELFPDSVEYGLRLALVETAGGHANQAVATLHQLRRLPLPASDDPRIDLEESRAVPKGSALPFIQNAVRKANSQGKRLVYARGKEEECMDLIYSDHPDAGPAACAEAQQIYLEAGNRSGAADSLRLIADRQGYQGHYEQALASYQQALDLLRDLGEHVKTGAILNNMATIYLNQGKVDHAAGIFKQALIQFEAGGERYDAAVAVVNMADVAYLSGKLKEARQLYQQSLDRLARLDHPDTAYANYRLGDLELTGGMVPAAHKRVQQAIEQSQPIDVSALNVMGEIFEYEGDIANARKTQQQALAVAQRKGASLLEAETQLLLARLALDEHRPDEGERLVQAALPALEKEKQNPDIIDSYTLLSLALLGQNKTAEARAAIERAASLASGSSDPALNLPLATQTARVEAAEARSSTGAASLAHARQQLQRVIADAKKLGYYLLECEARVALGELELKTAPSMARAHLASLASESRSRGVLLLADEAQAALDGPQQIADNHSR